MDCDHCGAPVRDDGVFCSHCGGRVKRAHDVRPAYQTATASERFDLVERNPGYTKACAHEPKASAVGFIVGSLVFLAFSVVFTMMFVGSMVDQSDQMGGFFYACLAFCLMFVAVGVASLRHAVKFARAPIVRHIAVVVDERTQISGGSRSTSPSTHYYATLQVKDGTRTEFMCDGQLAGRIATPDVGVAFTKDTRLVDFIRFDV